MMNDTYGPMYAQPLMRFDQDTQSWRTSLDTSLWDLPMSSPTLPESGLMRNGELFERPMLERPTSATGSSSLPTPRESMHKNQGGNDRGIGTSDDYNLETVAGRIATLPTPISQNAKGQNGYDRGLGTLDDQNLAAIATRIAMLPTPTTQETHSGPSQRNRNTVPLNERVKDFFPTPVAGDGAKASTNSDTSIRRIEAGRQPFLTDVVQAKFLNSEINWGKYETAIRRWEALTREVPEPTVPHKEKRRLNPDFVEWMMGLPEGHVTGHGLSAAKELKMLGNGVVPQQARSAVTQLMERITQ